MANDSVTWRQKIKELSRQAYEYAVARFQKGRALDDDTLQQVVQLQDELRSLAAQLRENDPQLHRECGNAISEGLLDFNYAINATPATSLRLNQYLENEEARKHLT